MDTRHLLLYVCLRFWRTRQTSHWTWSLVDRRSQQTKRLCLPVSSILSLHWQYSLARNRLSREYDYSVLNMNVPMWLLPTPQGSSGIREIETDTFKLHCHQTLTGVKFVVVADRNQVTSFHQNLGWKINIVPILRLESKDRPSISQLFHFLRWGGALSIMALENVMACWISISNPETIGLALKRLCIAGDVGNTLFKAGVDQLLDKIYELYADFALKNPFYSLEMPIR